MEPYFFQFLNKNNPIINSCPPPIEHITTQQILDTQSTIMKIQNKNSNILQSLKTKEENSKKRVVIFLKKNNFEKKITIKEKIKKLNEKKNFLSEDYIHYLNQIIKIENKKDLSAQDFASIKQLRKQLTDQYNKDIFNISNSIKHLKSIQQNSNSDSSDKSLESKTSLKIQSNITFNNSKNLKLFSPLSLKKHFIVEESPNLEMFDIDSPLDFLYEPNIEIENFEERNKLIDDIVKNFLE